MAAALSPARKSLLKRDGFVVVPGVVPAALTSAAVREINHRLGTGKHPDKDAYADKGLEAVDKALATKPDYVDGLVYKGLLLRVKAQVTNNLRLRQQYLDQAQTLAKQAKQLRTEQASAATPASAASASPAPGH